MVHNRSHFCYFKIKYIMGITQTGKHFDDGAKFLRASGTQCTSGESCL